MIDKAPLQRAIDGATTPVYPSTKGELIDRYKELYPKNWNRKLSEALQPFLPLTKSGQPQSIKNIERRHQARAGKGIPEAKGASAKQYEALGKTLEPIRRDVPGQGLKVTVTFQAPEDKGHAPRERTFTVNMSSMEAFQYVNTAPGYDELFDAWFDGGADAYGDDGDYEAENVEVTIA